MLFVFYFCMMVPTFFDYVEIHKCLELLTFRKQLFLTGSVLLDCLVFYVIFCFSFFYLVCLRSVPGCRWLWFVHSSLSLRVSLTFFLTIFITKTSLRTIIYIDKKKWHWVKSKRHLKKATEQPEDINQRKRDNTIANIKWTKGQATI